MQPKLAIIAPYRFYPPGSGGQHAVYHYLKYLSAHWPTISIGVPEPDLPTNIEHHICFADRPSKYFDPRVGWRIRRLLQREQVKTLALQHHYHSLLLWPFLLGLGLRVIIFSHNHEYQRWRSIGKWWWPLMYLTERWAYHWANAVFFISKTECEQAPAAFGLTRERCHWAPFPIALAAPPLPTPSIRQALATQHGWSSADKIILFFGPQSYAPNLRAVEDIVFRIHPLLLKKAPFPYRIVICGGGLPERYDRFTQFAQEGVNYLGFVPEIEPYVQTADLVLIPINNGGGVKIKLIEAVAQNTTVLASTTAAQGIDTAAYGQKLRIVADTNWEAYVDAILALLSQPVINTPTSFYAQHHGQGAVQPILDYLAE